MKTHAGPLGIPGFSGAGARPLFFCGFHIQIWPELVPHEISARRLVPPSAFDLGCHPTECEVSALSTALCGLGCSQQVPGTPGCALGLQPLPLPTLTLYAGPGGVGVCESCSGLSSTYNIWTSESPVRLRMHLAIN